MTPTTEDYQAAEVEPVPPRALPLAYATPDRGPRRGGVWPLLVLAALILGASMAIFAIITDNRLRDASSLWAGAVAVVALAAMGVAFGHFLTRPR
jgi:uncharacterized BrkB/YihY/UPF0761 family membrane protein